PSPEMAAVHDLTAGRPLRVLHREDDLSAALFPDLASVSDLAAAFRVERRAIQDQLRLARAGQLLVFDALANDGHDPPFGRRRLVAQELRVALGANDRFIQRDALRVPRKLHLAAGSTAVALLGEGLFETEAVNPHAVFRGQLDGQVNRESERVVESECDRTVEHRRIRRQALGSPTDHPLAACERTERLLELARSRVESARELAFLVPDDGVNLA